MPIIADGPNATPSRDQSDAPYVITYSADELKALQTQGLSPAQVDQYQQILGALQQQQRENPGEAATRSPEARQLIKQWTIGADGSPVEVVKDDQKEAQVGETPAQAESATAEEGEQPATKPATKPAEKSEPPKDDSKTAQPPSTDTKDSANGTAQHDPFSLRRAQDIQAELANQKPKSPYEIFIPPPHLKQWRDNQDSQEIDNLSVLARINRTKALDSGCATLNSTYITEIGRRDPALAAQYAVNQVEAAIQAYLRDRAAGKTGPLKGLTDDQTIVMLRERAEYNKSGPETAGKDPKEVEAQHKRYEELCKAYLIGEYAGVHSALLKNSLQGYPGAEKTAQSLYDLNHKQVKDADGKPVNMTDAEIREEVVKIWSHVPPEGIAAVHAFYAAIPQRELGQKAYDSIAKGDLDGFKALTSSLSGSELQSVLGWADNYAVETKKPKIQDMAYAWEDQGKREDFQKLLRGFDAHERAVEAIDAEHHVWGVFKESLLTAAAAGSGAVLLVPGQADAVSKEWNSKQDTVYNALGYKRGAEHSNLTAAQQQQVLAEIENVAKVNGDSPEEIVKVRKALQDLGKDALDKPLPADKACVLVANYRVDAGKVGVNVDQDLAAQASAIGYGFEATKGAKDLHAELLQYDPTNPAHSDANQIMHLLKYGSDPERTKHLTPSELRIMILAHDGMYVDYETGKNLPLRGLLEKLQGDDRVQAMQIFQQGFYASEAAENLSKDISGLAHVNNDLKDQKTKLDRLDQIDKEYRKLNGGKTLVDGINASSLSEEKKAELLLIAYLPRVVALKTELDSPKPRADVLEPDLKIPGIEKLYAATYPNNPGNPLTLRGRLEKLGVEGKVSREWVVTQELRFQGLPEDTLKRVEAEIDPKKPLVGTKDSIWRSFDGEQRAFVNKAEMYLEEGRAKDRHGIAKPFTIAVREMYDQKIISTNQALRFGLLASGNDPWDAAEAIAKNKLDARDQLAAQKNPLMVTQVREVYREVYGKTILRDFMEDKNFFSSIKARNADEQQQLAMQFIDDITDLQYGKEARMAKQSMELAISDLGKADIKPEEKTKALADLDKAFTTAANGKYLSSSAEIYDSFYAKTAGDKALQQDIDGLAAKGVLTPELKKKYSDMLAQASAVK